MPGRASPHLKADCPTRNPLRDPDRPLAAPFPGVEIDELVAQTFAKAMLECNLPPLRFRRLGSPSLYCTWVRPALFATALVTDLDRSLIRRTIGNAGVQLDFRFVALSHLDFTVSLGYAVAFEDDRDPAREFMFSLRLP